MRKKNLTYLGLAMALLLVSACGSSGGGLGDILGGGSGNAAQTVRGTVDYVDVNNHSIYLTNATAYNTNLANGSTNGNSVRVAYDNQTTVTYQGQSHRPEDLERGDEVEIRTQQSGSTLVADTVTVLRDVSQASGSTYPSSSNGSYGSTMRGTVRSIDTGRRTMQLDRGYGNYVTVEYDANSRVMYNGRNYNFSDLENGDEIDVSVTDLGNNRFRAQDVTVVRSISDNGNSNNGTYGSSSTSSSYATVRGTVRYVDTSRRTIELEQTSWMSGFTGSGNSNGSVIVVTYPSNASVEVNGRSNAITGLERGDVIDVQVDRSSMSNGNSYFANRIILVRDVNVR